MSALTQGQAGMAALEKKNYPEAIKLFSEALPQTRSPMWLLGRAQAYQQTGETDLALQDAELAYHIAAERGNDKSRKQMIEAQYRRAVLLFRKGRYADADCCCVWAQQLAEGKPVRMADTVSTNVDSEGNYKATLQEVQAEKFKGGEGGRDIGSVLESQNRDPTGYKTDWNRAYMWRSQALMKMESLPADDAGRKVTVSRIPPKPTHLDDVTKSGKKATTTTKVPEKPAAVPTEAKKNAVPQKLRFQFYQSDKSVTVDVFVKNTVKDKLNVDFLPDSVVLSGLPTETATAHLNLGGRIRPAESKYRIASMKVELTLAKEELGKWATWGQEATEGPRAGEGATKSTASAPIAPQPTPAAPEATASTPPAPPAEASEPAGPPSYPTSSKSGPKNWDDLAKEEEDDDDDKDVNHFFKQLYKNATPEQQRAMMKSFTESNGTSLSTDWGDVKDRKVQTVPPEGVEPKKWDA